MQKELQTKYKQISSAIQLDMILEIIFFLLIIHILISYEKLNESNQNLSVINQNNKGLRIVNLMWLNDYDIILCKFLMCESENISHGRSYVNDNTIISDCVFSRLFTINGDGGVVFISPISLSINVSHTIFYNCSCSGSGGAIYFSSTNSYLRMICANRCSANNNHFAYLSASLKNQVEYLSLTYCSYSAFGYYSVHLNSGDQSVENANSSMNYANQISGICFYSPSSFTNTHCTFSNNKVSSSICLYFYSSSGTISMSYANIVHNNSPYSGIVYATGEGSRKLIYCIFHNNSNTLFYIWSGSLEVSHSFIDHSSLLISAGTTVSTANNNSLTKTITYRIQYFNSVYCNADLPIIGLRQLNTMDQTNLRTSSFIFQIVYLINS